MLVARLQTADYIPFEIKRAFIQAPEPTCPEQHMWQEFIARMSLDALGETGESERDKHENALLEAWRWWRHFSEDVTEALDLSGIDRRLQGIVVAEIGRIKPELRTKIEEPPPVKVKPPTIELTASVKNNTGESTTKKYKVEIKKKRKTKKRR